MAITSLAGVRSGARPAWTFQPLSTDMAVGNARAGWLSLWPLGGCSTGAGALDKTTAGGVVRSSSSALVSGQLPHFDPSSGNSYLARLTASATQPGFVFLCDRLLDCGAISTGAAISPTATTAQTLNTTTLPTRDSTGASNGHGVMVGIEYSTSGGSGGSNITTLSYTNSTGAAGRTATQVTSGTNSLKTGEMQMFGLQSGDDGVGSVQTMTLTASQGSSTVLVLVLFRILAMLELPVTNTPYDIDAFGSGFPRLYNGAVPWIMFQTGSTSVLNLVGTYMETQG